MTEKKRPAIRFQFEIFIAMVRKQLIVMTRYPVDFVASFAQIFIMILLFTFAAIMFFPFRALPDVLQWLARWVPLSYSVDAFRSTLMSFPAGYPELAPIGVEVPIVIAFGILAGARLLGIPDGRAPRSHGGEPCRVLAA